MTGMHDMNARSYPMSESETKVIRDALT